MKTFFLTLMIIVCVASASVFFALRYFGSTPPQTFNIIIPNATDARTQHDYFKEKHAWISRLTVQAYAQKTQGSIFVSAEKEFLEKVCRVIAYPADRTTYTRLAKQGEHFLRTGCNDPLVRLCVGQMLYHSKQYEAAEPILKSAYEWMHSHYPWIHAYYALQCLSDVAAHKLDRLPGEAKNHTLYALMAYCESVANGEFSSEEAPIAFQLLNDLCNDDPDLNPFAFVLKSLVGRNYINDWYRDLLQGRLEIDLAWQARGSGWAKDVTPEGWKGFAEHLDRAGDILRKTWQQDPQRPEAAAAMISVAMGGHAAPDETAHIWFERAVQAQMDYPEAFRKMLHVLKPRWGGSHARMLAFGEACLETGRFDTDVPLFYLYVLRIIGSEQSNNRWRLPFRDDRVRTNLKKLFVRLLETPGREAEMDRIRTQQALATAWCGDYRSAQRLLGDAGTDVHLRDGFWGKSLSWNTRKRNVIAAEYQLFTGDQSELMGRAEALELSDNGDDAVSLYTQAMLQVRNAPHQFDYLRDRIAALRLGKTAEEIGLRPMFTAVDDNAIGIVTFLLDNAMAVDCENRDNWTPLALACRKGHAELAELLIARGADVSHKALGHITPLHMAARHGNGDIVRILLEHEANINGRDKGSYTPLTTAIYYRKPELAKHLIEMGADIEIKSYGAWAPLHHALNQGQPEIAMLLIDRGARVSEKTSSGWTPLHLAAQYGYARIIARLIAAGADRKATLPNGSTALMIARQRRFEKSAAILEGEE